LCDLYLVVFNKISSYGLQGCQLNFCSYF